VIDTITTSMGLQLRPTGRAKHAMGQDQDYGLDRGEPGAVAVLREAIGKKPISPATRRIASR
jgi:hypothetical protein